MAAARHSQDVLEIPRRESGRSDLEEILNHDLAVLDAEMVIQNLPPEIREKIYKELVAIKMRERRGNGLERGS